MEENNNTKQTISDFNNEVEKFMGENSSRIACTITSAVSYTYQPLIVAYQKYFNNNVLNIYDSKAIYAHNHELKDFIYIYFILTKENKNHDPSEVKEHCDIYVKNFVEFNEKVFTAISAQIYDVAKNEIIKNIIHGDQETFKELTFIK